MKEKRKRTRAADLEATVRDVAGAFGQARIPYMLIGALALPVWGRPRATLDIDFMILATEIPNKLTHRLVAALDGVAGCQDNLGQSWVGSQTWQTRQFVSGYHFFVPADGAVQAGLTSIVCDVSSSFTDMLANFGHGSIGGEGEQIIQFFEVATSDSGAKVVGTVSGIYPVPSTFVAAVPPANGAVLVGVTTDEYYEHIPGAVIGIGATAATDAGALQAWSNCTGPCKPYESFMETTWGVDDGSGTQIGRTCPADNQFGFSQQCAAAFIVRFQIASPSMLQLITGTGTGPTDPTSVSKDISGTITARYPLGSTFFVQLVRKESDGTRTPITATMALASATVAPTITGPTLFGNTVAIEFDRATSGLLKYFQSVHRGTVNLVITPSDTSINPVTVAINVTAPDSLGTTQLTYDARIVALAHRYGIPPQFLKAQIQQESGFNPTSYRYEPLKSDMEGVTGGKYHVRTESPYSLYRLATSDGLAQGTQVTAADIAPRSFYLIVRNSVQRAIAPEDTLVSAAEIYAQNNTRVQVQWFKFNPALAEQVRKDPTKLNFTAQTTIASSYGLLQVLYTTAINPMRWAGISGARNPRYLFDTSENITAGAGSLEIGAGYLRRIFFGANKQLNSSDPLFAAFGDFKTAFSQALNAYNNGTKYGGEVLARVPAFSPRTATPIF